MGQHSQAKRDLTAIETHFAFGENWASFAGTIDKQAIKNSEEGVLKLLPRTALRGKTFLDIGCGSGLHSLAAARLGVARVLATDIDPISVQTTERVLVAQRAGVPVETKIVSVFDLDPDKEGRFDIVYSWGVLHHSGNMIEAIRRAARMTAPGGLFAFALYRRTSALMDRFWTWEKQWYAQAPKRTQARAQSLFVNAMHIHFWLRRKSFSRYIESYRERGADFRHDVHDWLGGSPYEVISPTEVYALMGDIGFSLDRQFVQYQSFGLFGAGCDEYVYRRAPSDPERDRERHN